MIILFFSCQQQTPLILHTFNPIDSIPLTENLQVVIMAALSQSQIFTKRGRRNLLKKKTTSPVCLSRDSRSPSALYSYPSQLLTRAVISQPVTEASYHQACHKLSLQLAKILSARCPIIKGSRRRRRTRRSVGRIRDLNVVTTHS